MAQLNVDDEWFEDELERRKDLIELVRQAPPDFEAMADGLAMRAWKLSRKYWRDGKSLIPEEVWAARKLEPLIGARLAERRPEGIYVRGTESYHHWVKQKKRGGEARAAGAARGEHGRFVKGGKPPAATSSHQQVLDDHQQVLDDHQQVLDDHQQVLDDHQQPPAPAGVLDQQTSSPPAFLSVCSVRVIENSSSISSNNPQPPVDNSPPHPAEVADQAAASKRPRRYGKHDMSLAEWMRRKVFDCSPDLPNLMRSDLEAWAEEFRRMQETDGVAYDTLWRVLAWTFDDAFWRSRIQSPSGARKNWEKLMKGYNESRRGFDKNLGAH